MENNTNKNLENAKEAAKKIEDLINEIKKQYTVWICERDDGNTISSPVNVEYNEEDERIYINAEYRWDTLGHK